MIKGFIFDLDGIITDTAEQHFLAWKELAESMNWGFNRELNDKLRGISRLDSIQVIVKHNNAEVNPDTIIELAAKKNVCYVNSLEDMTSDNFLPGAKELLVELKTLGYKIALGSASKNARIVLKKLEALDYFDVIGDGNSVSKSKPEPDIFLYGSKGLGLDPSECIVFEDAESGVDAAIAGGFYSVGIGPKERIGHASICFSSMEEVSLKNLKTELNQMFKY